MSPGSCSDTAIAKLATSKGILATQQTLPMAPNSLHFFHRNRDGSCGISCFTVETRDPAGAIIPEQAKASSIAFQRV